MDIFLRPPSASWEAVCLPDVPGAAIWAWIRPPAAACGIIFQISYHSCESFPGVFTIRRLLDALEIDCRLTRMCFIGAESFDAMQGLNPQLDLPLSPPARGANPSATVHLAPPTVFAAPLSSTPALRPAPAARAFGLPARQPCGHAAEAMYHTIESDWHAIQILESKNLILRNQLNASLSRMLAFNREMSPDERNASDTQDHRDWQEARRWIRDGAAILARIVRAHDIGTTSAAGVRNRFDDLIGQFITPRRPLENLAAVQHLFEVHRKTVQSLNTEMQSAHHGPARDGESKAQAVMARVRVKVQAARGKR
ncbi:hypothetical protein [Caulifigura coniformis]|nr:hypothetical protein [Caulifigura coniformis]